MAECHGHDVTGNLVTYDTNLLLKMVCMFLIECFKIIHFLLGMKILIKLFDLRNIIFHSHSYW